MEVYGSSPNNWGDLLEFQGDYINYGFWDNILLEDNKILSIEERIESSLALYQEVIKNLHINEADICLELGCGRGVGIINALTQYNCKKIIGLDLNPTQIERAKKNTLDIQFNNKIELEFMCANAEDTKLPTESIDKIFSLEAVQHFDSIANFAKEAKRVLKPNGRMVFATYFLKSNERLNEVRKILSLIDEHLENTTPVNSVCNSFIEAGFKNVTYRSIGEFVFYGYDKWVKQVSKIPISQSYYKAYLAKYIDYYVFEIE
jgi:cyclopropane fatty-acyl-phospholipid synthase-like methyltransferase